MRQKLQKRLVKSKQKIKHMKITKQQLKQIIKEELLKEDRDPAESGRTQHLSDFWMGKLNSALIEAMANTPIGNSMQPSEFLQAIMPVLAAYRIGDKAQEMIDHIKSNQDYYSPRSPESWTSLDSGER